MFKSLIATCLFTFSCSSGTLKKTEPHKALFTSSIQGNYCWYQDFDFTDIPVYDDVVVLDNDFSNLVPFYFGDENGYVYLQQIYFDSGYDLCFLDFYYYTNGSTTIYHKSFSLNTGMDWTDTGYEALHFYVSNQIVLTGTQLDVFSSVFTHEANPSVVTYDGYYTFYQNQSLLNNVGVTGYITFDNHIYFNMFHYKDNLFDYVVFQQSNSLVDENGDKLPLFLTQSTPLSSSVPSQIYMTNCMMSLRSAQRLESIGAFTYIADSHDSSFSDLFFNIADTPVQFLFSLMSFELFGVTFFYAFVGILTLIVIVFVIKKVV